MNTKKQKQPIWTHGKPGSPIDGSGMVRDYCRFCLTPIRVTANSEIGHSRCDNCPGTIRDNAQAWSREAPQFSAGRAHTGG